MWVLPWIGYVGSVLGFGVLTLAIASGLYYLSELVEEHTVLAKRLLVRTIYVVLALQALLALLDGFPWSLAALNAASHLVYLGNMRRFPHVQIGDPLFLLSCVLVLVNHYLCFRHFSSTQDRLYQNMHAAYYAPGAEAAADLPSFGQIASFFGICVWLVPFSLFISLSASENVLPSMSGVTPSPTPTSALSSHHSRSHDHNNLSPMAAASSSPAFPGASATDARAGFFADQDGHRGGHRAYPPSLDTSSAPAGKRQGLWKAVVGSLGDSVLPQTTTGRRSHVS